MANITINPANFITIAGVGVAVYLAMVYVKAHRASRG